jgi:hypothetical protein
MMRIIVFIVSLLLESAAEVPIVKTWIWGVGVPVIPEFIEADDEATHLLSDYTDHGFIQLEYKPIQEELLIKLVKRPPGEFYAESEPFCSRMLPTTIAQFIEAHQISRIKLMSVVVHAQPYMAACKCYMRTMISMGMNRVGAGDGVVVKPGQVESYCDWRLEQIIGRPALEGTFGYSPDSVSNLDHVKLHSTVSVVIINS